MTTETLALVHDALCEGFGVCEQCGGVRCQCASRELLRRLDALLEES